MEEDKGKKFIEVDLEEKKIIELTKELVKLKETKTHFHFQINKNDELLIHHNKDSLI